MMLLTALTWTQLFSTEAPDPAQLVPTRIAAPALFAVVVYLLDRKRAAAAATASA